MPEDLYNNLAKQTNRVRTETQNELLSLEIEVIDTPELSVEQIVAGTLKTLQNLDLTDKKFIVKKIINKIVATQKEATIWGHIPILVTEKVGYEHSSRYSRPT